MKDAMRVAKHSSSRHGHPLEQGVNAAWWSKTGAQPGRRHMRQPSLSGACQGQAPGSPLSSSPGRYCTNSTTCGSAHPELRGTWPGRAVPARWVPLHTPCCAMPCLLVLCCAVPYCATPCPPVPCPAVLCYARTAQGTRGGRGWPQPPGLAEHPHAWPRGRAGRAFRVLLSLMWATDLPEIRGTAGATGQSHH